MDAERSAARDQETRNSGWNLFGGESIGPVSADCCYEVGMFVNQSSYSRFRGRGMKGLSKLSEAFVAHFLIMDETGEQCW